MTLLTAVLGILLIIAVIFILVQRLTDWLERQGGMTIQIEVTDDSDD